MTFRRQLRRCRWLAALVAALLALALPAASSAAGVDVDGDQVTASGGPGDWQTLAESGAVAAQLEPSPDNVIDGDEQHPGTWTLSTTSLVTPSKADALGYWWSIERDGAAVVADLAAMRAPGTGHLFLGFEVNQRAPGFRTSGGVAVPTRTEGDLLVSYDIWSGGVAVDTCRWNGNELAGAWEGCEALADPVGTGTANGTPILAEDNFLVPGRALLANQFAEAAVDLTQVFGDAARDCRFGWVWLHTRTSASVSSRPVDYVAPQPLVDQCVTPLPPLARPPLPVEAQIAASTPPRARPAPELGRSVNLELVSGDVTVTLPNGKQAPLGAFANVPVGSGVDATNGVIRLTSARNSKGRTQTGRFWGGTFKIRQRNRLGGRTELILEDRAGAASRADGASAAKSKRKRKVWGEADGNFRTRGRYAAGTVRGTRWLTEEGPGGTTVIFVKRGTVLVRDFRRHKTITVHTGERYAATPIVRRAAPRFTG